MKVLKENFQRCRKSVVYETSITIHHKLTFSVLRKIVAKGKAKTVLYRCCKRNDQKSFNKGLQNKISQANLENFFDIFYSTLDVFGPY